jgi:hypothetical protein
MHHEYASMRHAESCPHFVRGADVDRDRVDGSLGFAGAAALGSAHPHPPEGPQNDKFERTEGCKEQWALTTISNFSDPGRRSTCMVYCTDS